MDQVLEVKRKIDLLSSGVSIMKYMYMYIKELVYKPLKSTFSLMYFLIETLMYSWFEPLNYKPFQTLKKTIFFPDVFANRNP